MRGDCGKRRERRACSRPNRPWDRHRRRNEIAMEAADMVLVKSALSDVVVALHLSSAIFRRIQLNFLFSPGYNAFSRCGRLLFIDRRPVDVLGVWDCHGDVVGVSGHFIVTLAALQGATTAACNRGACMSRCWNWTLTMMNVADTSRRQELALGRNEVQQALR